MHLEGKLHAGYLKIRKKLQDLKNKRAFDKKSGGGSRYRSRSRSRSPRAGRRDSSRRDIDQEEEVEKKVIFSSKRYGSGRNVSNFSSIKFADEATKRNSGWSGASFAMDNTSLGKEWRYYKRELDSIRRKEKKDAERAAGITGGDRPSGGFNGPRRDF